MNILVLISNRLIKLFGHSTKALSYIFHYIFPNKRFIIPNKSSALFKTKHNKKIPAIIWQTNYTNRASLPVYLNYLFNRLMCPSHEYRFMGTEDRAKFIATNFSGNIYNHYLRLNIGASQADFWRLLVLKKYGGIYIDIDAHLVWPAAFLIKPGDADLFLRVKKIEENHYSNYFIASKKDNPIIDEVIQIIIENIDDGNRHTSVYDLTGPDVLNKVLEKKTVNYRYYRYTCIQGSFTNEYFQYIDKPGGRWTHAKPEDLLVKNEDEP